MTLKVAKDAKVTLTGDSNVTKLVNADSTGRNIVCMNSAKLNTVD